MTRGRKPEMTYDEMVNGIFYVVERLKIKHMPTQAQFFKIEEVDLGERKVHGKVLYNRIQNQGLQDIRDDLLLPSKKEYETEVLKSVLRK